MRRGGDVCADNNRQLRDGDLHTGIRCVLPERCDDSQLHDGGGTELIVYSDGDRRASAEHRLSCEYDGGNGSRQRRQLCCGQLRGASGNGQLSWSNSGVQSGIGKLLSVGNLVGQLYGDRCSGQHGEL